MNETHILTKDGLDVLVDEIKKYVQDKIVESKDSVLEFDSSLLFPTVGKPNTIYIDTTLNESYRWSDSDVKYYRLDHDDYTSISIINGCGDI